MLAVRVNPIIDDAWSLKIDFRPRQPVNMTLNEDDKTPLLAEEGGVRHRSNKKDDDNKEQEQLKHKDWDPNLPYGGKVYLARRKKPEPLWIRVTEVRMMDRGMFELWYCVDCCSVISLLCLTFLVKIYVCVKLADTIINKRFWYVRVITKRTQFQSATELRDGRIWAKQ